MRRTERRFKANLIALALSSLTLVAQAADGITDLGTLGGTYSYAYGVSADGAVVVGRANIPGNAGSHAFRWTGAGGMADLGYLMGGAQRPIGLMRRISLIATLPSTSMQMCFTLRTVMF